MLFAVGRRCEYFYRIEMSMPPPLRYATGTGHSLIASPIRFASGTGTCGSGMQATLNPSRGFTPRPPVSNLGDVHTDAVGFGVSPRGVQGRPLVWIIYTFINVDRPPSRRRVGSLSTLILIKSEYCPILYLFRNSLLSYEYTLSITQSKIQS